jgi:GGDEF domain-containing protein
MGRWIHVTKRQGLIGLVSGVLGLALGALAALSDVIQFAVLAGALALVAGVAATRLWQLGRNANRTISELSEQVTELETERDAAAQAHEAAEREREAVLSARIRERAVRAGSTGNDMLTDPETGLFSEGYFLVAVDARVASARRHLRPVAIVLMEVVEGLDTAAPLPAPPEEVTRSVKATLREADTACRLKDGTYALLLEDTPENGAIWTVERLRRQMADDNARLTMWAGVSCYPAHGFNPAELLDAAEHALDQAREWRQDRIEVATAPN